MTHDVTQTLKAAIDCHQTGRPYEAMTLYKKELEADPRNVVALNNYATLLLDENDINTAITLLRQALDVDPNSYTSWSGIGNACQLIQDYPAAITCYEKALRLQPNYFPAIENMAAALRTLGEFRVAETFFRAALEIVPEDEKTHLNYALFLLTTGRYKDGFSEYEWHWKSRLRLRGALERRWDGAPLNGKTLLVVSVGGFGDVIQFARFLPWVAQMGGPVVISVRKPLLSLFQQSFPALTFVEEGDEEPPHDYQTPIMSLAHHYGVTLETIPFAQGYLQADAEKVALWKERLARDNLASKVDPLRVGLVWAGASHRRVKAIEFANRRRSIDLETLAPLAQGAPDALFYSLQLGDKKEQAAHPPAGMTLVDHTRHIQDFSDTAALITQLDVVVAVDTSTAHLAAALGKPVLMLSRFDQCWRWLSGRMDSPWYDTLRVYQQARPFDWSRPLEAMSHDLAVLREAKMQAQMS